LTLRGDGSVRRVGSSPLLAFKLQRKRVTAEEARATPTKKGNRGGRRPRTRKGDGFKLGWGSERESYFTTSEIKKGCRLRELRGNETF